MTSNHPEKLDPALIRPGRIDKVIKLGFIEPPEAIDMLGHYFSTSLTADQITRLSGLFFSVLLLLLLLLPSFCDISLQTRYATLLQRR